MDLHTALNLSPDRFEVVSFTGAGGKSTAMFRLADEIVARGGRVITTTTTRIAAEQIGAAPAFLPMTGSRLPLDEIAAALERHGHCLLIGRETVVRGAAGKKAGIDPRLIDELASQGRTLNLSALLVEADGSRMLPAKAPTTHEPAMPASSTLVVSLVGMDAIGLSITDPYVHRPERMRALLGLSQIGERRLAPAQVAKLLMHEEGGRKRVPPGARILPLLNKADTPPRLAAARLIAHRLTQNGQPVLIGAVGRQKGRPIIERWGPSAVVVLAAGGSSRMGRPKQVAEVDGEPMVTRAARIALQGGAAEVLVVTGAYAEPVTRSLARFGGVGDAPMARLSIVHNRGWQEGQASSIRSALEALPARIEAVIFLPVDQPFTPVSLLRRLQQRWREGAELVAPLADGRTRGAPALFGRRYWPELMALQGDVGARGILQRHACDVVPVPAHADTLRDIDRPDQVER